MDIGAFGKSKGKTRHGKGKARTGQQGQDTDKDKDKNKDSVECSNCGKRGHYSKDCWSKKDTNKGGSKGKHKSKNATDAHNLDSTKPANAEPEVEIGGFDMSFLDVDALQQQESEWIKIGVDTGAGKTAWPQSVTYGREEACLATLTSVSAQQLENLSSLASDCTSKVATIWGVNLRVRGIQAPVCKPLLSVGEYTTMGGVTVLYGDKGYLFHRGSNVAKKIDAWIQKEMRDSQYHGCTVAYKENTV